MTHQRIFNYASQLRELGNTFILSELKKAGLQDIVPSHGVILAQLLHGESRNMSELAQQAHRTKSTVTTLVSKLERNGYVERIPDPADSRGVKVRLTDKGLAMRPAVDAISDGLQKIINARLTPEEALQLEELLAKCLKS